MLKQGLIALAAAFAASGCVVVSSERVELRSETGTER